MSGENWHTIRVPPEAYKEAKVQKKEAGRTWGEQLVAPVEPDTDDSADVADRLDKIEATAREAADAAQSADRKLEELAAGL